MNNNNPRPLGVRKTVQLLVILTLLAWATQTLFHQWGYGAIIGTTSTEEQPSPSPTPVQPAAPRARTNAIGKFLCGAGCRAT